MASSLKDLEKEINEAMKQGQVQKDLIKSRYALTRDEIDTLNKSNIFNVSPKLFGKIQGNSKDNVGGETFLDDPKTTPGKDAASKLRRKFNLNDIIVSNRPFTRFQPNNYYESLGAPNIETPTTVALHELGHISKGTVFPPVEDMQGKTFDITRATESAAQDFANNIIGRTQLGSSEIQSLTDLKQALINKFGSKRK